jgi:hypothetical protein
MVLLQMCLKSVGEMALGFQERRTKCGQDCLMIGSLSVLVESAERADICRLGERKA